MKTNLLTITWKKEKKHWKRVFDLYRKIKTSGGIVASIILGTILSLILTVSHYAFMLMHNAFEMSLFIFNREAYKNNIEKMENYLALTEIKQNNNEKI